MTRSEIVLFGSYLACAAGLLPAQPTIVEFPIPTAASSPSGIVAGPDGNLWITEAAGNKIGKITTTGAITEFAIPTQASGPSDIAAGPDGNLWFTETMGNKIGKISTAGAITEYPVPSSLSLPTAITAGRDGNLWFTEGFGGKVGKITPSGSITEYVAPLAVPELAGIAAGPDGNIWFPDPYGNQICAITPTGQVTEYPLLPAMNSLSGISPTWITAGPDGNLWVTASSGSIWRITTTGIPVPYYVPVQSAPYGITAGADGNLWFTESGGQIGRLTPGGAFTEYSLPNRGSSPALIVTGPDGNLWFTESQGNRVGKLVVSSVPAINLLSAAPSTLSFTTYALGPAPASQTLAITAASATSFSVSTVVPISIGQPWISLSPSGTLATPQTLTVSINPANMGTYGTYVGNIVISSGGVSQVVFVSLILTKPPAGGNVSVTPTSLAFSYATETAAPQPQQLSIADATQGVHFVPITISYAVSSPPGGTWLGLLSGGGNALPNGSTGTSESSIFVNVNPVGLAAGSYSGAVTITPLGGSVWNIPVSLIVTASSTTVSAAPSSLTFLYQAGGAEPPAQVIQLTETGPAVGFSIGAQCATTLSLTPSSGTGSSAISVSALAEILGPGTYPCSIGISLATKPVVFTSVSVSITVLPPHSGFQEFPVPTSRAGAQIIVPGPDGSLWFTESQAGKIGRISTAGSITEFGVTGQPYGVAAGPDGNLWFTDSTGSIGRLTPAGTVTRYPIPASYSSPAGIAAGPDGNLWFADIGVNQIGRITTSGVITGFPLSKNSAEPTGIAAGPDGNLWFTERYGNAIGKITPTGTITEFPVPTGGAQPEAIVQGPDGNLWFVETGMNEVGKITPGGTVTEYRFAVSQPLTITPGSDGNLWFTEANGIARVTPSGTLTTYTVPTEESYPFGIALGSDGNLWFTEFEGNKIGKYVLAQSSSTIAAVVNAASFGNGAVAPGEIVTIGGSMLGPAAGLGLTLNPDGSVATSVGGVTVTFNGHPAPLIYVSANQINCVVPYEVAGTASVVAQVAFSGESNAFPLNLAAAAPAIFTRDGSGSGTAAIANGTGGYNGPDNPAPRGSTITFYVTGEGKTNPAGVTGSVTALNTNSSGPLTPQPLLPVTVTIGGQPATIAFYGEAPGLIAGLMQLNVQAPQNLSSGSQPLVVSVGAVSSPANVNVWIQ